MRAELTLDQQWSIVHCKSASVRESKILSELSRNYRCSISRDTLQRVQKKFIERDEVTNTLGRGRKKILNESDVEELADWIEENPFSALSEIVDNSEANLYNDTGKTIRKSLTSLFIRAESINRNRIDIISPNDIELRLEFCRSVADWS